MKWKSFTFALASGASIAAGADAPQPALTSKTAPATSASASTVEPADRTTTSTTTTARLSESLPKFTPSPKIAAPRPGEPSIAEPKESEGPRSPIVLLPQYDVREEKLPTFLERELLTREGRADVALRRHPGLRFGPLAFLNVRRGLEMLEEEDAIDRRREMAELVGFSQAIEKNLPADPTTGVRTVRTKAPAE